MSSSSSCTQAIQQWIQKYKEMDPKQRKRAVCFKLITPLAILLSFLAFMAWLLWPTDPEFTILHHEIRDVNTHPFPPTLNFKMDVTVKVRNKSVYTFKYDSLNMTIRHDGNLLAVVEPSGGGHTIRGKDVSFVNKTLDIDMIRIIKHSPSLIADLFTHLGAIPLVIEANVTNAKFGIGSFTPFSSKSNVTCEMNADVIEKEITDVSC